jgi:hypothetical protein
LTIANPSFESPVYADGGFSALVPGVLQGSYGWAFGDSSGIYNPPAADFGNAGGSGTPLGANGAQVAWVYGFGDYRVAQRLAGDDAIPGNGDDPVLAPFTIYTLTVAVGQRAVGNQYGATYGGYDIQLVAGLAGAATIVGRDTDVVTPPPGTFVERTLVIDTANVAAGLIGLPLTIVLRKTVNEGTADVDYDNVRLDASPIPPSADFDGNGVVNAADLIKWKAGYGTDGTATRMQGDADRSLGVDGSDFLFWQRQLGVGGAAAAPEPSAACLGWIGLATSALALRRRRCAAGGAPSAMRSLPE